MVGKLPHRATTGCQRKDFRRQQSGPANVRTDDRSRDEKSHSLTEEGTAAAWVDTVCGRCHSRMVSPITNALPSAGRGTSALPGTPVRMALRRCIPPVEGLGPCPGTSEPRTPRSDRGRPCERAAEDKAPQRAGCTEAANYGEGFAKDAALRDTWREGAAEKATQLRPRWRTGGRKSLRPFRGAAARVATGITRPDFCSYFAKTGA